VSFLFVLSGFALISKILYTIANESSFIAGCALANEGSSLDDLFRLRSDYVCSKVSDRSFHSYLSGFLIANGIRAEGVSGTVHLCGSKTLSQAYAIALDQISVKRVTIAGHLALAKAR
jgi:2-keto-3-deoxy-galactonokinase